MIEHLSALKQRYGTDMFYLSQDSVAPKTLLKLAEGLIAGGLRIRWATDLKPEKYLTAERAETLASAAGEEWTTLPLEAQDRYYDRAKEDEQ